MQKAPRDLGKPGRALWRWLQQNYELAGTEPLLRELCRLEDRLAEVRGVLAAEGIMPGKLKGRRHPLADSEVKLSGQYMRVWRTLGLADESNRPRIGGRS
jgi:hypothetical protein